MEPLNLDALPDRSLLLIDSAPIIYVLDASSSLAKRFDPLFEAHEAGRVRLAITTVAIAEVLAGPLQAGDEARTRRYRALLQSWQVVALDLDIAEAAARLRASLGLKLLDAVQVASALAINAAALVTHDRDFKRVQTLRILS